MSAKKPEGFTWVKFRTEDRPSGNRSWAVPLCCPLRRTTKMTRFLFGGVERPLCRHPHYYCDAQGRGQFRITPYPEIDPYWHIAPPQQLSTIDNPCYTNYSAGMNVNLGATLDNFIAELLKSG